MRLVLALAVGGNDKTDEEHGCTRGTHERGQDIAQAQDEGVGERGGLEVAPDADATRGDEEGHEEQDEGDIVVEHLVLYLMGKTQETEDSSYG